jgi:hypothetical protein
VRTAEFQEDREPTAREGVLKIEHINRMRELIRAGLAIALTLLMAAVVLIIIIACVHSNYSANAAKDLLGVVLAPLVGLVGAATGFYYGGKER